MIVLVLALVVAVALLVYVHRAEYPHIDDVLRDLDREDREADRAARLRMAEHEEKIRANLIGTAGAPGGDGYGGWSRR